MSEKNPRTLGNRRASGGAVAGHALGYTLVLVAGFFLGRAGEPFPGQDHAAVEHRHAPPTAAGGKVERSLETLTPTPGPVGGSAADGDHLGSPGVREKAVRYEAIVDKLRERGDSLRWLSFDQNLVPSDDLGEFLGLTDEQEQRLNQLCAETSAIIKDWERESAEVASSSEDRIVYEVPANPELGERAKAKFAEALASVAGEDALDLLNGSISSYFEVLERRRVIELTIEDAGEDYWELSWSIEGFLGDEGERDRTASNALVHKEAGQEGAPGLPARYDHLIQVAFGRSSASEDRSR